MSVNSGHTDSVISGLIGGAAAAYLADTPLSECLQRSARSQASVQHAASGQRGSSSSPARLHVYRKSSQCSFFSTKDKSSLPPHACRGAAASATPEQGVPGVSPAAQTSGEVPMPSPCDSYGAVPGGTPVQPQPRCATVTPPQLHPSAAEPSADQQQIPGPHCSDASYGSTPGPGTTAGRHGKLLGWLNPAAWGVMGTLGAAQPSGRTSGAELQPAWPAETMHSHPSGHGCLPLAPLLQRAPASNNARHVLPPVLPLDTRMSCELTGAPAPDAGTTQQRGQRKRGALTQLAASLACSNNNQAAMATTRLAGSSCIDEAVGMQENQQADSGFAALPSLGGVRHSSPVLCEPAEPGSAFLAEQNVQSGPRKWAPVRDGVSPLASQSTTAGSAGSARPAQHVQPPVLTYTDNPKTEPAAPAALQSQPASEQSRESEQQDTAAAPEVALAAPGHCPAALLAALGEVDGSETGAAAQAATQRLGTGTEPVMWPLATSRTELQACARDGARAGALQGGGADAGAPCIAPPPHTPSAMASEPAGEPCTAEADVSVRSPAGVSAAETTAEQVAAMWLEACERDHMHQDATGSPAEASPATQMDVDMTDAPLVLQEHAAPAAAASSGQDCNQALAAVANAVPVGAPSVLSESAQQHGALAMDQSAISSAANLQRGNIGSVDALREAVQAVEAVVLYPRCMTSPGSREQDALPARLQAAVTSCTAHLGAGAPLQLPAAGQSNASNGGAAGEGAAFANVQPSHTVLQIEASASSVAALQLAGGSRREQLLAAERAFCEHGRPTLSGCAASLSVALATASRSAKACLPECGPLCAVHRAAPNWRGVADGCKHIVAQ
jgi:hypothetical protein